MSPLEIKVFTSPSQLIEDAVLSVAKGSGTIIKNQLGVTFASVDEEDTQAFVRVEPVVELGVLRQSRSPQFLKRGRKGYVLETGDILVINEVGKEVPRIVFQKT